MCSTVSAVFYHTFYEMEIGMSALGFRNNGAVRFLFPVSSFPVPGFTSTILQRP